MQDAAIDRQFGVNDVILGTAVRGQGNITGSSAVRFSQEPNAGAFRILLSGMVRTRTTGRNGPAIVHCRSASGFAATREVRYVPGRGFIGLHPVVRAKTDTTLEGIDSVRGGLIGRIVRNRAARTAAAQHEQARQIAQQKIIRHISADFSSNSDRQLAQLNRAVDWPLLLANLLVAGNGPPRYSYSATPHYLQFAISFGSSAAAAHTASAPELPQTLSAPLEIWIRPSVLNPRFAAAFEWAEASAATVSASHLLTLLTGLVVKSSDVNTSSIVFAGLPVKLRRSGAWQGIAWIPPGRSPAASAAAITAARPTEPATPPPSQTSVATNLIGASFPSHNYRTWTSGQFRAHAEFLALDGNTVRLLRSSGIRTTILFEKLSSTDQQWITSHLSARASTAAVSPF